MFRPWVWFGFAVWVGLAVAWGFIHASAMLTPQPRWDVFGPFEPWDPNASQPEPDYSFAAQLRRSVRDFYFWAIFKPQWSTAVGVFGGVMILGGLVGAKQEFQKKRFCFFLVMCSFLGAGPMIAYALTLFWK